MIIDLRPSLSALARMHPARARALALALALRLRCLIGLKRARVPVRLPPSVLTVAALGSSREGQRGDQGR